MTHNVNARAPRPRRLARVLLLNLGLAVALLGGGVSAVEAQAQIRGGAVSGQADSLRAAVRSVDKSEREVRSFYERTGYRPLWTQGGNVGPEAERLLELVGTADADGLDPRDFRPRQLASAIDKARRTGSPKAVAAAELLLSQTLARYVRAVRTPRDIGMTYVDQAVVPKVPARMAVLEAAAQAPSLARYLDDAAWAHPLYSQLRTALNATLENDNAGRGPAARTLRLNLERARILPADPVGRYVLVDAAAARLFMYDGRQVKDSMRVVVGKPDQQTPMMAGMIRFATLNPYWNIPPDLARTQVAANVLGKGGMTYLKTKRYEVLSDWTENARVLNPAKVDWRAVAAGRQELRVRQLPGKGNAMGKMKFMFPNDLGIYLHDTSERGLLTKEARLFSSGCVRLEDAPRLARWLFGKPLAASSTKPEQSVNLPAPVPIYITYLTAAVDKGQVAFRPDVYRRDTMQMARLEARRPHD
ncbi:MAG TPA: L,D-transpeptidase family protein [Allosphingosinicella sp.]